MGSGRGRCRDGDCLVCYHFVIRGQRCTYAVCLKYETSRGHRAVCAKTALFERLSKTGVGD